MLDKVERWGVVHIDAEEFIEIERRVAELKPLIEAHANKADEQRHLSNEVARSMALAGLYRVAVPKSLDGAEAHPITQIRTIEAVSEIHGSTGWNLMIGIEVMGILGATYTRSVTEKLYADPGLIIAGTLNPLGTAIRCNGGYRITGQWPLPDHRAMAVCERRPQCSVLLESEHRPRER